MANVAIASLGLFVLTAATASAQVVVPVVPINPVPLGTPQPVLPKGIVVDVVPITSSTTVPSGNTTTNEVSVSAPQLMPSAGTVVNVVPVSVMQQAQATGGAALCPADLTSTLNRVVTRTAGVRWGVLVQTQGAAGDRVNLYAWNPRVQLAPASNNKIFTTAAALHRFGPQFRLRTTVTGNNTTPNLAVLRITGQGDPSLRTSHMAVLAQRLNQRGIRQVNLLIGDDTYFSGAAINPNWDADDTLAGYGAPVNSLMINQNGIGVTLFPQRVGQPLRVQWDDPSDAQDYRLNNRSLTVAAGQGESIDVYRDRNSRIVNIEGQLRVGSASEPAAAAINNPGNYLLQKFRNALTAAQIGVTQATVVKSTPAPPGEVELASLESPTLPTLLNETNQESNNIYAEALLKTVGKAQNPNNTDATLAGVAAVKAILAPLGVDPNQYSMVDGSGLADNNRATPESLVQALQAMANSSNATIYRTSLPVAGVSGTLKSRFRNTAAQNRVQAKTGTISGVVSLSGYATPPNYAPLVFSILANSSSASATTMRSAMDEMVVTLMRLRRC
ncbi:MAG: D-alanyl-D-alanine carboxypeptidase/D-alanyl-D-alanine-endopeptidase [Leptolyngbyaceae cyanobacterium bins.349]|nr:D-alanyl-D-alanine carboxypeptidase/D-alanyl-D-alanine-endopeptidase [Leptolyngbyaceae cyanobacterium bins.349]